MNDKSMIVTPLWESWLTGLPQRRPKSQSRDVSLAAMERARRQQAQGAINSAANKQLGVGVMYDPMMKKGGLYGV